MRVLVLLLLGLGPVLAYGQKADSLLRTIEVIGEASVEVVPDEIYLRFGLTTIKEPSKAFVTPQEQEIGLLNAVLAAGLDSSALEAADYYKRTFKLKPRTPEEEALETRFYRLKIRNSQQFDAVFSKVDARGILSIEIEKARNTQHERLELSLYSMAAKNALIKAEALLLPFGSRPGKLIAVSNSSLKDLQEDFAYALQGRALGIQINGRGINKRQESIESVTLDFQKYEIKYSAFFLLEIVED
ncbi:MAG: SIMPL domain-containing protein [Bacteroidia bacterium]|nr:SIMPL domain-containing protein [Bacteroidia bacterium]